MTRKHYIQFAKLFSEYFHAGQSFSLPPGFLDDFMEILSDDNPNFNYTKFREACEA